PHRRFDGGRSCRAGPPVCWIVQASLHDEHVFPCARCACLLAQHDVIYALDTLPVRKHSEAGTHSFARIVESPTERSVKTSDRFAGLPQQWMIAHDCGGSRNVCSPGFTDGAVRFLLMATVAHLIQRDAKAARPIVLHGHRLPAIVTDHQTGAVHAIAVLPIRAAEYACGVFFMVGPAGEALTAPDDPASQIVVPDDVAIINYVGIVAFTALQPVAPGA